MIETSTVNKLEAFFDLPEDAEVIDDTFYVWKTRFGLYSTMTCFL